MQEKVADNYFRDKKSESSVLEENINKIQKKLDNLENMEENFTLLNKNIVRCIELLDSSLKGKNVEKRLDGISETNKINYKKAISIIGDEKELVRSEIKQLYEEKEKIKNDVKNNKE